ncbi:capsular polysaccharide transport system permease protein [Celeribacter baekdonensis]|uniref:Capsular polysaccharide transport system permease protein n=1 Tax=Celeribacter baekdonensis TaxID=875171 RepID=A0A1G7QG11_9RHOB|nr:ABC transporter permease [Celeribacter baekdonensis]SDF97395.1 capsular polysaccharide transport system permease protein [Celeribacter baekdonensis]
MRQLPPERLASGIVPPQRPKGRKYKFGRTVIALILREVETRYSRALGGYLWAFFEPVAGITFLSFIFSLIAHKPALGSSFPLFYASGFLPFGMFMAISNDLSRAVRFSKPLLQYPAIAFIDALIARLVLNLVTQGLVMTLVFILIVNIFDLSLIVNWSQIFLGVAMLIALGVAIGILNCYIILVVPLWEQIWSILTRPLLIISGVLFLPESFSQPTLGVLMLNPICHFVGILRSGIYSTYDASASSPLYVFALALFIGTIGMILLSRNYKALLLK